MADEYLSDREPLEQAAKEAAAALGICYSCLTKDAVFKNHAFLENSILFAEQYYAMYCYLNNGVAWRVKPKMHLFLELCSEGTDPTLFGPTEMKTLVDRCPRVQNSEEAGRTSFFRSKLGILQN